MVAVLVRVMHPPGHSVWHPVTKSSVSGASHPHPTVSVVCSTQLGTGHRTGGQSAGMVGDDAGRHLRGRACGPGGGGGPPRRAGARAARGGGRAGGGRRLAGQAPGAELGGAAVVGARCPARGEQGRGRDGGRAAAGVGDGGDEEAVLGAALPVAPAGQGLLGDGRAGDVLLGGEGLGGEEEGEGCGEEEELHRGIGGVETASVYIEEGKGAFAFVETWYGVDAKIYTPSIGSNEAREGTLGCKHVIHGCGVFVKDTPRDNACAHTHERRVQAGATKMDVEEPQSTSSNGRGQSPLVAKRAASQDPGPASKAKRIKTSHSAQNKSDVQPPAITRVAVPFPEKPAVLEERNGEIEFRVVNNDGDRDSMIILTGLKCLFQKQLPKMPKDYIARLVYDRTHLSIAIVKLPLEVIGGITFREFRARQFAEIVFCAVSSDQQVKGYGAHLMAHLKDYVKATSPVMHFLTYADNYATGYFQKQGFAKEITLDKSAWMGYIKDYEGGTLMQCPMVPRIRYLEVGRMLLKQKETVQAKIRILSKSHIVHQPPQQWANGDVTAIDPLSIPAIRATGWSPDMDALAREPRHGPHFNELRRFLYQIQNHKQAWPFLNPVNRDEVPDYYNVITSPMDLSTIEEKLEKDQYSAPRDLVADLELIFSNCKKYNDATTVYTKCAVKLEKHMWSLIKDIPEWFDLLED
ncbi:uncharacterized protein E0L32_005037 [Thyridium curvatum]|uniref:histone acetyltransferase n=1 Tax=Thyridium curvatum TaxID=1093900 RepID=A0A507BDS7_9PEZI|nr:uncharacterized protein E0L32_005037 [Thyridium curvatum]TPX14928.1 hypothetical protein E0L32_005037 [Thyridium curvatum]